MASMNLRDIIIIPDKRLRVISEPIKTIDAEVKELAADMLASMYDAPGIGLAAIQVAVPKRMITIDVSPKEGEKNPKVLINPKIVWSSEELSVYEEGCLSIPDIHEEVERPARVRVRYIDLHGETREEEATGLYATCVQHEIDHLDGVLFIDYISRLKRNYIVKKFTKAAKRAAG